MTTLRKARKPADELDPLVADLIEALARAAARRDTAGQPRQQHQPAQS